MQTIVEYAKMIFDNGVMVGFYERGFHFYDLFYLLAIFLGSIYAYTRWEMGYFSRRGIKSLPFRVPFLAHLADVVMMKEHIKDMIVKHYNSFPGEKYVGIREFGHALVQLRDLELVKQVAIKDFDHFHDHQVILDEKADSILGNNLFSLRGEKWRDMRATLTPAFTGSKMRNILQFVTETSEQMTEYFTKKMDEPENREKGFVEAEMKDIFTRFSNDVIATVAFGVRVNSLVDQNNEFYEMGKIASNLAGEGYQQLKLFMIMAFPELRKFTNFKVLNEGVKNFFRNLVLDTMKKREGEGIVRPDMIHLLKEARNGCLKFDQNENELPENANSKRNVNRVWTDDEIVAQALIFFLAGFDSTSTLFCYLAHEIVTHPEVQRRLHEEIDALNAKIGDNKIAYQDLAELKYMDMVLSETLRLWPANLTTDRKCVKSYTLPPSSGKGKGYTMKVGEGLAIPIYAFHLDPKYFPNPKQFDPERFSEKNKHKIVPYSYMPFGLGPRNCIGSRFALMEAKALMYHLLSNFELVRTEKTAAEFNMIMNVFSMLPKEGFWMGLKPRA